MKILHFQLSDPMNNKSTLISRLENGEIKYSYFSGWSSSGTPLALSNLHINLPIDKEYEEETQDEFILRVLNLIQEFSPYKVFKVVETNIKF